MAKAGASSGAHNLRVVKEAESSLEDLVGEYLGVPLGSASQVS